MAQEKLKVRGIYEANWWLFWIFLMLFLTLALDVWRGWEDFGGHEYRVVTIEDSSGSFGIGPSLSDQLHDLSAEGWKIVSTRRCLSDGKGAYEFILER